MANFGLDVKGKDRLDWYIVALAYQLYDGLGGVFNPGTFSTGIVIHLVKR